VHERVWQNFFRENGFDLLKMLVADCAVRFRDQFAGWKIAAQHSQILFRKLYAQPNRLGH